KGFIRSTGGGTLGVSGEGIARYWRLTEIGYRGQPPTREYRAWKKQKPVRKFSTRCTQDEYGSGGDCTKSETDCYQNEYGFGVKQAPPCTQIEHISRSSHVGVSHDRTKSLSSTPKTWLGEIGPSGETASSGGGAEPLRSA